MKKTLLFLFISALSYCFALPLSGQGNRYLDSRFDDLSIQYDIIYGTAPALVFPWLNQNNTQPQDLHIDVYMPAGDTIDLRPAIIFAHSGGFLSGSRNNEDMIAFCDTFARKGYVCINLEYRLGMIGDDVSGTRAVYRALQDSRAAIRFLKEKRGTYGIDTNNVYIAGSSAGSFVALQNYFMNEEGERPELTYAGGTPPNLYPDLGCLDCSGNNYPHGGRAQAAMGLWGAISDTLIQKPEDQGHVFLVHGTDDDVVMFDVGPPWGYTSLPDAYGSWPMSLRLQNLGFEPMTYFVPGEGHEFYNTSNGMWDPEPNEYWDTVLCKAKNFFYRQHKPQADFSFQKNYLLVQFSPASNEWPYVLWNFGDSTFSSAQNPQHLYDSAGSYTVQFIAQNMLGSRDTIEKTISVEEQVFVDSLSVFSKNGHYSIEEEGGKLQFSYRAFPSNASDTSVSWSVYPDDGTAEINAFAMLTAKNNGEVWVKASALDGSGKSDSVQVLISGQTVLVTDIEVQSATGNYFIDEQGGRLQMLALVSPENATDTTVVWSVNNATGMAVIDTNGLLTAATNGLVYAVARAHDASGVKDSAAVEISNQALHIEGTQSKIDEIRQSRNKLYIKLRSHSKAQLKLISLTGSCLFRTDFIGSFEIPLDGISPGLYILHLKFPGGNETMRKLLIQ